MEFLNQRQGGPQSKIRNVEILPPECSVPSLSYPAFFIP